MKISPLISVIVVQKCIRNIIVRLAGFVCAEHDRVLGFESKSRTGPDIGATQKTTGQKERGVGRMFEYLDGSCVGHVSQTVQTHQVRRAYDTPTGGDRKHVNHNIIFMSPFQVQAPN